MLNIKICNNDFSFQNDRVTAGALQNKNETKRGNDMTT